MTRLSWAGLFAERSQPLERGEAVHAGPECIVTQRNVLGQG